MLWCISCVCSWVLTVGVVLEERSGKDDKSANSFASCKKKNYNFQKVPKMFYLKKSIINSFK